MDTREAFIALNLIEGVGPVRVRSLLEHFGGAPKSLAATAEKIARREKPVELRRLNLFGHD